MVSKRKAKKIKSEKKKKSFTGPYSLNKDAELHYLRKNISTSNTAPTLGEKERLMKEKTNYTKNNYENDYINSNIDSNIDTTLKKLPLFDKTQQEDEKQDKKMQDDSTKSEGKEKDTKKITERTSIDDNIFKKWWDKIKNNLLISIITTTIITVIVIFITSYFENIGKLNERSEVNKTNIIDIKKDIKDLNKNFNNLNININNIIKENELLDYKIEEIKKK